MMYCTTYNSNLSFRKKRRENDNLEQQAQALFKAWFVDDEIETKQFCLSEVCESITDGVHNTVLDNPHGSNYLLSCKNIKNGEISISNNERRIDDTTFNNLRKRTKLAKGDILLSSVGTIGEFCLLNEDPHNYEFQRSVAILKPNIKFISSPFLYCYLKEFSGKFINLAHGAVQQCIFLSDLRSYNVTIPSKIMIDKFSIIANKIFDNISERRNENKKLIKLRDVLLPKLMSGELKINDLNC